MSCNGPIHKHTLLSPPDTAKISPVIDQLTCQITSLNVCKTCRNAQRYLTLWVSIHNLWCPTATSCFILGPQDHFAVLEYQTYHYSGLMWSSWLTCEQLASLLRGRPMLGAQATSLTQSVCASNFSSHIHESVSSLNSTQCMQCNTTMYGLIKHTWDQN